MAEERRDLQGLKVITKAGETAVAPKGGLPMGERLWVPCIYRGQRLDVTVDPKADAKTVESAMLAAAEAADTRAAATKLAETAALDAQFMDIQKAYADLGTGKATTAQVKAKLLELSKGLAVGEVG
jgi:hypothetical protein